MTKLKLLLLVGAVVAFGAINQRSFAADDNRCPQACKDKISEIEARIIKLENRADKLEQAGVSTGAFTAPGPAGSGCERTLAGTDDWKIKRGNVSGTCILEFTKPRGSVVIPGVTTKYTGTLFELTFAVADKREVSFVAVG